MTSNYEFSQAPNGRDVGTTRQGIQPTPAELREIVKEAYVYGFPMVDSYRIQHSYFVDQTAIFITHGGQKDVDDAFLEAVHADRGSTD